MTRKQFHLGASWIWTVIVLACAFYNTHAIFWQKSIQVDLMELLPSDKTEAMREAHQFMEDARLMKRFVILLGHSEPNVAKQALSNLRQHIKHQGLAIQEQPAYVLEQQYRKLFESLYPFRANLLSEKDRALLLAHQGLALADQVLSTLMLPFGALGPANLKNDPFFLYPKFVRSLLPALSFQQDEDKDAFLTQGNMTWYIFNAHINESGFSIRFQQEIAEKLLPFLTHLSLKDGLKVLKTGGIFYSLAGFKQANNEISTLGLLSILAVVGLFFLVFQSLRPLLFALLTIFSGISCGIFTCFIFFGTIHLIALVFGCSLIGITIDYVVYYCFALYKKDVQSSSDRYQAFKSLMPALLLSVLASSLGYATLSLVPFPGIQQMAVLGAVGLVSAFTSVFLWGPYLVKTPHHELPSFGGKISCCFEKIAAFGTHKKVRMAVSLICLIVFVLGAFHLNLKNDIREFQSLDADLKREESQIQSLLSFDGAPQFFILKAKTVEELLQNEEALFNKLQLLKSQEKLSTFRGLAQLIPSEKCQQENRHLVAKLYETQLASFQNKLGIPVSLDRNALGLTQSFFKVDKEIANTLPDGWKELIHFCPDGHVVGRILITKADETANLADLSCPEKSIQHVDILKEHNRLFQNYSHMALIFSVFIFLIIISFLTFLRGFQAMTSIISPVLLSVLTTAGIIGLIDQNFSIFHIMAIFLVLCIGVDYAIFLYFRVPENESAKGLDLLLLSNGLCALTTLLSFGLLALSSVKAVQSFGLSVFIGITLCFFTTTLFLGKKTSALPMPLCIYE